MNSRCLDAPIDCERETDFDEVRDTALFWLVTEWGFDADLWPSVAERRERTADRLRYEGADEAEVRSFLRTGWDRFDRDARAEALSLAREVMGDPTRDEMTRLRARAVLVFAEDTSDGRDLDNDLKESRENAA